MVRAELKAHDTSTTSRPRALAKDLAIDLPRFRTHDFIRWSRQVPRSCCTIDADKLKGIRENLSRRHA